jgi:hypothetical protein
MFMSSNVAKISELIVSFNNAVNSLENLDERGRINWNYVDADIHLDASDAGKVVPEEWYEVFDDLADEIGLKQLQESV